MAAHFRRLMSMQHWPDDVRRLVGGRFARDLLDLKRSADEPETRVEILSADEIEPVREAWRDLARRAIEPNPFFEPDFASTALMHLPESQRPVLAAVWQTAGDDPRARMIGLWALEQSRANLFGGVGRSWSFRHGALGTPLIDRLAAARSVDAMLLWLRARRLGRSTLVMAQLACNGPAVRLIKERCGSLGLVWAELDPRARAVLASEDCRDEAPAHPASAKHRRELDRLARRLAEQGAVAFRSAWEPADIRHPIEWFLAMEQSGWKGRRGTSFLSDVGDAAFLRVATRRLAHAGKCRVDWLALDDRPIAMAIVLRSGERAYFWKTTFDERFARYSPGVQLARRLAETQMADPAIRLTDSCAIANHPMIDRVWPDRQAMVDLAICVDPARINAFPTAVRREKLQRAVREAAKSAANAALRRQAS